LAFDPTLRLLKLPELKLIEAQSELMIAAAPVRRTSGQWVTLCSALML
jgi:hypothetical protein